MAAQRQVTEDVEVAVADEPAAEACRFGWFDGTKSHVCRKVGPHDRHYCSYDQKFHDPTLRVIEGPMGRLVAVHR